MKLRCAPPRVKAAETRRVLPPLKVALPFYSTPEWKALMRQIIAERGRRCQDCGREGCRVFGDHIQELSDGGAALDPENVRLKCGSCHTAKTMQARKERAEQIHE